MKNNFHLKNDVLSKVFLLYENLNPQHRGGGSKYKAKNMSRLMKNLITTHIMDMRNQGEFDESKSQ